MLVCVKFGLNPQSGFRKINFIVWLCSFGGEGVAPHLTNMSFNYPGVLFAELDGIYLGSSGGKAF